MKKYSWLILFFSFAVFTNSAFCQWEKLLEADDHVITDVRFDESTEKPKFGYALFYEPYQIFTEVWATTDGGDTWIKSILPPQFDNCGFKSIAIKDSLTAWVFGGSLRPSGGFAFKTADGGISWAELNINDGVAGAFYIHKTRLLFANIGGTPGFSGFRCVSSDEGNSWNIIESLPKDDFKTGFAFTDDSIGIEGGGNNINGSTRINRTTDSGISWQPTETVDEFYQPLAIRRTQTFFIVSEIWNHLLRSDDGGLSWDTIYYFPKSSFQPTGSIVGDLCHLYVQMNGQGLWESIDQGISWHKIADFDSYNDTRFCFQNNVLYVGNKAGNSSNPHPGALWRYKLPPNKPTILADNFTLFSNCGAAKDTTVPIAAINQCDGEKAIIDTIFTSGSTSFSLSPYSTPKEITVDSLQIHYNPVSTQAETTFVHLRFRLKGNTFDTVMAIRGSGVQPKETVDFTLAGSTPAAAASSNINILISSTRTLTNKGLNEIAFDLTYSGDLLGMPEVSAAGAGLNVTLGAEQRSGKFVTLPVTIKGTNISLDSAQPLASVKLFVFLSDSTSTPIQLSTIKLNSSDPDYERCTLSATSDTTNFSVYLHCGDSTIVEYMRGNPLPLRIVSLKPNPAQNELAIELDAAEGEVTQMEIYDELGNRVMRREISFAKGRQSVSLSTIDLPEGMYSVRMGNASGRFVKVK
jgi:hypothetical protein